MPTQMNINARSVHEPESPLLSAKDAIQDGARLRALYRPRREPERAVSIRVPLWALLEAIDYLRPYELRLAMQRAQQRLAAAA